MKNSKHKNLKLTLNKLKFNLIEKRQLKWQKNPHNLLITQTEENNDQLSEVNIDKPQDLAWQIPMKIHNLIMDNGSAYHSADITRLLLKSGF